ncbi:hypothetical protein D3C77_415380 [compost metagenome]
MGRQIAAQLQAGHVLVGRIEGALKAFFDLQQPVEVEGVGALATELLDLLEPFDHLSGHLGRVVDDDLVVALRLFAQGGADEGVQLLQVRLGALRPGEDDRERQVAVVRVHEDAEQVEELFGGTGATGEDDDAVADTHKGFQALFDIRQDHQLIDDRVRRFGSDDPWLGQAQVAAAAHALLGMGDGRALHRAFHHARAAAGADVQLAQAQLMADLLGVLVFLGTDRMTAPAHHHLRLHARAQGAGVAQQVEDVVGDALGAFQVDALAGQFAFGVDDVAQGAEQHLAGAGNHLTIDKGVGRRVEQLQAYTAILLVNTHLEVLVGFENGLGVVDMGAGVEDCQGALAEQGIQAAGTGFTQLLDFTLRQCFKAAFWAYGGIDDFTLGHSGFPVSG